MNANYGNHRGACADCTPMNTREGCLKCELAKDTAVDGSASKRHDRVHQRVALLRREVTETWRVWDLAIRDSSSSTLTSVAGRLKRVSPGSISLLAKGYLITPSPLFFSRLVSDDLNGVCENEWRENLPDEWSHNRRYRLSCKIDRRELDEKTRFLFNSGDHLAEVRGCRSSLSWKIFRVLSAKARRSQKSTFEVINNFGSLLIHLRLRQVELLSEKSWKNYSSDHSRYALLSWLRKSSAKLIAFKHFLLFVKKI